MTTLLYIEASPRGADSRSGQVANELLEKYAASHPDHRIDRLNLWEVALPAFNGDMLDANYAVLRRGSLSAPQEAAWKEVVRLAERFKAADKFVFSLPRWNFGVPYILKQYIDIITQPGVTFTVTPEGLKGLLAGKSAVLVCACGNGAAAGHDFQKSYMEAWLGLVGITNVKTIWVAPTIVGAPQVVADAGAKALGEASSVAASF